MIRRAIITQYYMAVRRNKGCPSMPEMRREESTIFQYRDGDEWIDMPTVHINREPTNSEAVLKACYEENKEKENEEG
jgi:hypothetical protein